MQIVVNTELAQLETMLTAAEKTQVPYAAAMALNQAARTARDTINAEMGKVFDRPTPFTQRSAVAPVMATARSLLAKVTVRPIQARYLLLEDTGGQRTPDMTTRKTARALLEPGAAPLNQFGNIPSGATARFAKAYAALQAARKSNVGRPRADRAKTSAGIVYIKGGTPQAHGHPGGFFRLKDGKLIRLEGFGSTARYKPRLRFAERVEATARLTFVTAFPAALARAMAFRRPP